ncbi:MAG: magnesium chelatase domain-containing protein [Isosphaeraceae bacterium]
MDRVVINLAPADLKKDANGFDLPIALGLLLASGQVAFDRPGNFAIVGELALTGEPGPSRESSRWPSRPSPRPAVGCLCPRPTPPRPPSSRDWMSIRSAA